MNFRTNKLRALTAFSVLVLVSLVFTKVLLNIDTLTLIKFAAFQIAAIFVPGFALQRILKISGSILDQIVIGYALGYCINILEYFVVSMLEIQFNAWILVAALFVISLLYILRSETDTSCFDTDWIITLSVFCAYLVLNIIVYSGNSLSPITHSDSVIISRDVQFWASNSVALKNSFPASPAFLSDAKLFYHYFSSLHVGFTSMVSGIDVFSLAFALYPFGRCLLLVGSINFILNQYSCTRLKLFVFACLLFMTGMENESIVTYAWHTIEGPFGNEIGIAFGILFVSMLIRQWRQNDFDKNHFIVVMLFWIATVGVKAPIASVLLVFSALLCLSWLFKKKYKNAFIYGGGILSIFLLISIFIVGMLRFINNEYEGDVANRLSFYSLDSLIKIQGNNKIQSLVYSVSHKISCIHPVLLIFTAFCTLLFGFMLITPKYKFKDLILPFILLLGTIIGLLMGTFISAGGSSEMYFTMAAFIPCIAFDLEVLHIYSQKHVTSEYINVVLSIVLVLISFIGINNMLFNTYHGGIIVSMINGKQKIDNTFIYPSYAFTKDESIAAAWIRDNTPHDSIVLNDRCTIGGYTSDYYYGIFTERIQYVEADDLLNVVEMKNSKSSVVEEVSTRKEISVSVYNNEPYALQKVREDGVDYIIESKMFSPNFEQNDNLSLVYSSGDVNVYELN